MRIRTNCVFILTILTAGMSLQEAGGQSPSNGLRGPVMGYVLDSSAQAIRPVNGIPGSSSLGESLDLPVSISAAAFSPRGDFALVVSAADDQTASVLRIGSRNNLELIEGAIGGADMVGVNADGSAGVLVSSTTRQLQIVHGLSGNPTVGAAIDLSSIPESISALALDLAGSNVLIAVSANHGALYLANELDARPRLIANFGSPAALMLIHQDHDIIVADAAVNEVTLIRNFASEPETVRIAGERDGISGPAGLQVSADGQRLYIADRASRTLDVWNFGTQSMEASYTLDAEPTGIKALQGRSMFVLNEVGDHPLLLLDAVNGGTYFVPAGKGRN